MELNKNKLKVLINYSAFKILKCIEEKEKRISDSFKYKITRDCDISTACCNKNIHKLKDAELIIGEKKGRKEILKLSEKGKKILKYLKNIEEAE